MGKLYGIRPSPANVNVPPAPPGRGQFPDKPAPIDFGKDPIGTGLDNPGTPGQGYPATPAPINFGDDALGTQDLGK